MSDDTAQARIGNYLDDLRKLKESSALREVVERELLVSVLVANKGRLSEAPSQAASQQHLADTMASRAQTQSAHAIYREWMSQFMAALNQYEIATRTGQQADAALTDSILNLEALLAKCLQGYIIFSGVARDEFNDVILGRFGESALAEIDDLAHAGTSEAQYWKSLLDRFVFSFVEQACQEMLAGQRVKMAREANFVAVRFALDDLLGSLPGTDKEIAKSRLQQAFEAAGENETAREAQALLLEIFPGLAKPLLEAKAPRHDYDLLAKVASMDAVAGRFVNMCGPGASGGLADAPDPGAALPQAAGGGAAVQEENAAGAAQPSQREFLKDQMVAMAAGAAMALGLAREDLGKGCSRFSAKEQERLLAVAAVFEPASLELTYQLMAEYALCALLGARLEDEGAKVQVKAVRQRRAPQARVAALAEKGFNRIRQKLFFEEDPGAPQWLLFKARSGPELAEAIKLSNIEPYLAQAVTGLWNAMAFKVEAVVLVNMALVSKTTVNVQAKLAEILGKMGLGKT